jgi:soluble P-type ATPase
MIPEKELPVMLTIEIPGYRKLQIQHVVCDFNGTIAVDGKLISGVAALMEALSVHVDFHVITADTFGSAEKELKGVACNLSIIPREHQAESKLAYVSKLGTDTTVCIGNGRNDRLMLKEAALGIGVMQEEGIAAGLLTAADIICSSIVDALYLLKEPKRLIATLRS